jgi:hypothetical protein
LNEAPHEPSIHLNGFSVDSHALSPTHSIFSLTHLPLEHNKGLSFGHPLNSTNLQFSRHIPSSHNVVLFGHPKNAIALFLFQESLSSAHPPSKHLNEASFETHPE